MEEHQTPSMDVEAGEDLLINAEDLFSEEDGGNQTAETSDHEEAEAEASENEPAEEGEEAENTEETPSESTEETFDLKYMKQTKQVGRQEVIELAQKGMDYDRAVQQRDALRNALQEQTNWRAQNEGILNALSEVAKQSNMDVVSFVDKLQENYLVQQLGLSRDAAKERIEKQKLQQQLDAKTQADLKTQAAAMQQTRAQKEIKAFADKYPDVDVKTIPQEVFQRAASGETSLIGAYTEHLNSRLNAEIKKLQAELAAEKQNKTNKQKAVGSARTEGTNAKHDDFMSGFNS